MTKPIPCPCAKILLAAALAAGTAPCHAGAGIATDGSVGPRQTVAGVNAGAGNFTIPQTLGTLSGSNLFHSFSTFNIDSGQTATFTTTSPSLANVINRVTGGSPSQINGQIRLSPASGAPAFHFINPAGIVFGAGASIDVPGAFHVGTANYLKFSDGNYHADLNRPSIFSSAPPEAFGFLGTGRATIALNDGASLVTTGQAQPVSIIAGDIAIHNASVATLGGGDIRIVALGQQTRDVGLAGALPAANGTLDITAGGELLSAAAGSANGGNIDISAGSITVDKQGSTNNSGNTGIVTLDAGAYSFMPGNAGNITLSVSESLSVLRGGMIKSYSSPFSLGNPGNIKVTAASVVIDGGEINSDISPANSASASGSAGSVDITATGGLTLRNGGQITSDTYSSAHAGAVRIAARDISSNGGTISSSAFYGSGNAGNIDISANMTLSLTDSAILTVASPYSSGNGGAIRVVAGDAALDGRGAGNDFGQGNTYILASSLGSGHAGTVDVTVNGPLTVVNAARIASETYAAGRAGSVRVSAGSIHIDGQGYSGFTGITSDTISIPDNVAAIATVATGNAGSVEVATSGNITLLRGGLISSDTYGAGNAGTVKVAADSITLDSRGVTTGISSDAKPFSSGHAGAVEILARGDISILNNGSPPPTGAGISSSTYSSGNAGTVKVRAGSLSAEGQGSNMTGVFSVAMPYSGSSGNAGTVDVTVDRDIVLSHGGSIATSTFTAGHAGSVGVSARNIRIFKETDSLGVFGVTGTTGIFSVALLPSASGNAGSVAVAATDDISIINHSTQPVGVGISSGTFGAGHAGQINVSARTLAIDGVAAIDAAAMAPFSQEVGSINVAIADRITLSNGGQISISTVSMAGDNLTPSTLSVAAPSITLANARINASSNGNADAGNIAIRAADALHLASGSITTSANQGHGGSVMIQGGRLMTLDSSQITTSVQGIAGNGGDIGISTGSLIMKTGFIQANTAASNASGGLVSISAQNLIPSGNTLFLGGSAPHVFLPETFGYNVIQAAAPTGVSGMVRISSPVLDISGSLLGLDTRMTRNDQLARKPCDSAGGSSLVMAGRGGLPPGAQDFLSPGQFTSGVQAAPAATAEMRGATQRLATRSSLPCLGAL